MCIQLEVYIYAYIVLKYNTIEFIIFHLKWLNFIKNLKKCLIHMKTLQIFLNSCLICQNCI